MAMSQSIDFSKPIDLTALRDKSVLITGGANGLGAGMTAAIARAGAYVTFADVNGEAGEKFEGELRHEHLKVVFVRTDVTSYASQLAAFKVAFDHGPKGIDLVIPNAGLGGAGIVDAAFPSDLAEGEDLPPPNQSVLEVNLTGAYYSTVLALHYFKKSPPTPHKKQIIFIASLVGYIEFPFASQYAASKFGVRGLWKSIRHQEKEVGFGFRTNLVAPWFIRTNMTQKMLDDIEGWGMLCGEVKDVVAGVLRLACDETIEARSICIPSDEAYNFDLGDESVNSDGSKILWETVRANPKVFGEGFVKFQA